MPLYMMLSNHYIWHGSQVSCLFFNPSIIVDQRVHARCLNNDFECMMKRPTKDKRTIIDMKLIDKTFCDRYSEETKCKKALN